MSVAKVTVVIPNYNGKHFLEPCLSSLRKQKCKNFEILIIDNASVDGSAEWIQKNYPEVNLMVMEKNLGFAGGVNVGIKAAKSPYILLLNNDTEVTPNFVGMLLKSIESSPKIFSVSSRMIQYYDREKLDDAGDLYSIVGWGFQRGVGRSVKEYKHCRKVFSACAGAAIYRKSVFEKIGYFDEMHFAYLEDIDVGYRAKLAGYENIYCPKAEVYHVGSGTSGSKYNDFKVKLSARNNFYLNYKNMPNWQLALNAVPLAVGTFIKWLFFKKNGFEKAYVDGLKEGFATRKKCKRVPYNRKNLSMYWKIEFELWYNFIVYCVEFAKRQIMKNVYNKDVKA